MTRKDINFQYDNDEITLSDVKVKIDDENDKEKVEKCFVIMPYGKRGEYYGGTRESLFIYNNIIAPAVKMFAEKANRKIEPYMEFQNRNTGSITKSILENIAKADICIVDITGHNPNVFFELGVRYTLRNKTTILLREEKQDTEQIPFDIQGFRCLTYNCFEPEIYTKKLCSFLLSSQDKLPKTDSLVFETFKDMEVRIPNINLASEGEACENLSWAEWWSRINELVKELKRLQQHDIHVVLGITNGGLTVADLLGRLLFHDVPILSLWANRRSRSSFDESVDRSCYYFDNPFNRTAMASIKEILSKTMNTKVGILLVDDLIYTSNTSLQAQSFIKKELEEYEGKYQIIFSPLYCRSSSETPADQLSDILLYKYIDNCDINDYFKTLQSSKRKFPYGKDLA